MLECNSQSLQMAILAAEHLVNKINNSTIHKFHKRMSFYSSYYKSITMCIQDVITIAVNLLMEEHRVRASSVWGNKALATTANVDRHWHEPFDVSLLEHRKWQSLFQRVSFTLIFSRSMKPRPIILKYSRNFNVIARLDKAPFTS